MSRHANAGRKLSRNTSHRKALLDNLVRAVILESIRTTAPKAKETRRVVERVITKARPGGYTRVIHVGNRIGENAPMAILELVEKSEKAEPEKTEKKA